VALAIVELVLQLYDPFGFRIKGARIVPAVNAVYQLRNLDIPGLDRSIVHTKNSLGFRGPEPPPDFERRLTIVAIGGSTTECYLVSDGKDWPSLLGRTLAGTFKDVWVNNAGLDGTSTYGHIVLMRDYVGGLRPKVALFMVGGNERYNIDGQPPDPGFQSLAHVRSVHDAVRYAATYSEVVSTAYNITYRLLKAPPDDLVGMEPGDLRLSDYTTEPPIEHRRSLVTSSQGRQTVLDSHRPALAAYRRRLIELISITRGAGIYPVFITQPLLYGDGVDEDTGVDLGTVFVDESTNGALAWDVLERYHDVLRKTTADNGVDLIDLARRMPKRSAYYIDAEHYTNAGSARIAELLAPEVQRILEKRWSTYRR
jgi:lysophospholipase L1-like esterase